MNLPQTLVRLKRSLPSRVEPGLIKVNQKNGRINLLQLSWLRPILLGRGPQLALQAIMLAGLLFTIAAGLFGPSVGSHNFAIIFVWIAWWSALKLAFIPLGGRSWCSVCPIPLPGDWLQRGGILAKGRGMGLNFRWPKKMRGGWLQSGASLVIGLFSAVTLTDPRLAGWVLLGLFLLAIWNVAEAALAEEEVADGADEGREDDDAEPSDRDADRPPPPDDPEPEGDEDRDVREPENDLHTVHGTPPDQRK